MSRERRGEGEPEEIGELIRPLLHELRQIGSRVGRALHEAWPGVVGPALARRTRLRAFKAGRLYVEVDSSVLLHELQNFRATEILERLREKIPKPAISEIRFRLGSFETGSVGGSSPTEDG